jgi:hypothetical protein
MGGAVVTEAKAPVFDVIRRYPPELEPVRQMLLERVAEIQRRAHAEAEPYLRELAHLEAYSLPKYLVRVA